MTNLCSGPQCLADHLGASHALAGLTGMHVGGVHVFDAAFHPGAQLPRHQHPYARFSFIIGGSIGEVSDDQTLGCERDALSFHPAVFPHRNEVSADGARAVLIEVCGDAGNDLSDLVRARMTPFASRERRLRDIAIELRMALRAEEPLRPVIVEAMALEFLDRALQRLDATIREPYRAAPSWLDGFGSFIDERLESHLSVAAVAACIRVTKRQLVTALRRYRGTTFVIFVRQRRLARAQELLRTTDMPIAAVALASGFSDQSHLTRCFREDFGITPFRFRERADTQSENSF